MREAIMRPHVDLVYSGSEPMVLKVPEAVLRTRSFTLKPGANERVPIAVFHLFGSDARFVEALASGAIKSLCIYRPEHRFEDEKEPGVRHCIGCGEREP
jgi:hypothetical protein